MNFMMKLLVPKFPLYSLYFSDMPQNPQKNTKEITLLQHLSTLNDIGKLKRRTMLMIRYLRQYAKNFLNYKEPMIR